MTTSSKPMTERKPTHEEALLNAHHNPDHYDTGYSDNPDPDCTGCKPIREAHEREVAAEREWPKTAPIDEVSERVGFKRGMLEAARMVCRWGIEECLPWEKIHAAIKRAAKGEK